jgi:hypothetical protein
LGIFLLTCQSYMYMLYEVLFYFSKVKKCLSSLKKCPSLYLIFYWVFNDWRNITNTIVYIPLMLNVYLISIIFAYSLLDLKLINSVNQRLPGECIVHLVPIFYRYQCYYKICCLQIKPILKLHQNNSRSSSTLLYCNSAKTRFVCQSF